jgi:type II secretory pathway component PulK
MTRPLQRNQQGAALIIAIWTIALLSLFVMSFALDATLESKLNLYVRERHRVDYLTQSGISIAEMLMLTYKDASASGSAALSSAAAKRKSGTSTSGSTGATSTTAKSTAGSSSTKSSTSSGSSKSATKGDTTGSSSSDEVQDKWLEYKLNLQRGSCIVKEYAIEEGHPENGVVTVEITSAEANHWPINLLTSSDTSDQIWENILNVIGLPMEYQEEVVDSWYDWRDDDSTVTGGKGGENEYYESLDPPYEARNGEIASVDELKMIKGIRDRLAIFDGGVLNPDEKNKKDIITIQYGLKAFFDIYGENVKININSASKEVLMTVPGIDGDEEIAGAIIEERTTGANMTASSDDSAESTLFKDWNDANTRIPGGLPSGCESYLSYAPEKYFRITITGESAGISHTIQAVAVIQSDEIRYLRWREDP